MEVDTVHKGEHAIEPLSCALAHAASAPSQDAHWLYAPFGFEGEALGMYRWPQITPASI